MPNANLAEKVEKEEKTKDNSWNTPRESKKTGLEVLYLKGGTRYLER